jgi:hypothetical protein
LRSESPCALDTLALIAGAGYDVAAVLAAIRMASTDPSAPAKLAAA